MDSYSAKTKDWLNERFRATKDGFFYAHQNIYGFKSPYAEGGVVLRYVIVCNVVKALAMLRFDSLLDVGGAEGYMAALVRRLFDVRVRSCDLSEEACARAREIFGVDADPVDGVALPYEDDSFDVVLSSETLEHIPDYGTAFQELLRVARKAVIVTVPHDGPDAVAENILREQAHAHLHDFTLASFRDQVPPSCGIQAWGLHSSLLRLPFRLIEGRAVDVDSRGAAKRPLVRALNVLIAFLGRFMNRTAFRLFLGMDPFLANRFDTYRQVVFVIIKDPSAPRPHRAPAIGVDAILDFQVPLHPLPERRA